MYIYKKSSYLHEAYRLLHINRNSELIYFLKWWAYRASFQKNLIIPTYNKLNIKRKLTFISDSFLKITRTKFQLKTTWSVRMCPAEATALAPPATCGRGPLRSSRNPHYINCPRSTLRSTLQWIMSHVAACATSSSREGILGMIVSFSADSDFFLNFELLSSDPVLSSDSDFACEYWPACDIFVGQNLKSILDKPISSNGSSHSEVLF